MTSEKAIDAGTDLNDLMAGEWKPEPVDNRPAVLSSDRIPALLEPIQNRVDDAEAKRARSRANPDPIWDASMILAIQASSADVPELLAAVQAVVAEIADTDLETGEAIQGDLADQILAAVAAALDG